MKNDHMVRTAHTTALIFAAFVVGAAWTTAAEAQDSYCFEDRGYSPTGNVNGTLHISSAKGATEIVEKLLNAGANPDAVNTRGYAPLHVAAWAGHTAVVEALLNAGANPNETPGEASDSEDPLKYCGGVTPLHFAARAGHLDIVDALLAAGADANAAAANGGTPMYWADTAGHVDVVISLLNAGATHQ